MDHQTVDHDRPRPAGQPSRYSWLRTLALIACSIPAAGCAICANPYDEDFAAFGGIRDRVDRRWGRVGSILDPAEATGVDRTVKVERSFVPAAGFRKTRGIERDGALGAARATGQPTPATPPAELHEFAGGSLGDSLGEPLDQLVFDQHPTRDAPLPLDDLNAPQDSWRPDRPAPTRQSGREPLN